MNIEKITNIVRALINSRKQPCAMRDIISDFREVENMDLDVVIRKFGYSNAYNYFFSCGEFILQTIRGIVNVSTKPNAKSAHVSQLVREQKSSKKTSTRLSKPTPPARKRPLGRPGFRNPTNYHQLDSSGPRRVQNPSSNVKRSVIPKQHRQENNKFEEEKKKFKAELEADFKEKINEVRLLNEQIKQLKHVKVQLNQSGLIETPKKTLVQYIDDDLQIEKDEIAQLKKLKENIASAALVSRDVNKNNNKTMKKLEPNDLRLRLTEKRINKTAVADTESTLRPILGQSTVDSDKLYKKSTNLKVLIPSEQTPGKPDSNNKINSSSQQPIQPQPTRIKTYVSVQERLKTRQNGENSGEVSVSSAENPIPKSPSVTHVDEPKAYPSKIAQIASTIEINPNQKTYKFDITTDPCVSIEQYCRDMGLEEPKYTISRTKLGFFYSQISVQNATYSTYPMEYPNELVARQNAAFKAINTISKLMSRKKLPPFPNEGEFLDVLYNELKQQPNGILSNKLEDWFAERFRYSVPKLWFEMVQKSRRFTMEQGVNDNTFIILANAAVQTEEINVADIVKESPYQIKALKLPFGERNWSLHITHCVSPVEIWAHLLGPNCSVRLNALTLQIEREMLKKKSRPAVIAAKHIYLIEVEKSFHRVRVEAIDKNDETVLVFHIDYGKTERLPFSVLYNCSFEFLDLPPQAVPFSLFGLDDFANFPNATKHLQLKLLNRSFIGEVITKEVEFEANRSIQMIMYDTSTDDDINMNDLLQEEICRSAPAPQLKTEGLTQVIVTQVDNNNGDVSLQLNMDYIKNTLNRIIESKFSREQHKCCAEELLRKQLLLVEDGGEWFRAKIADDRQVEYVLKGGEKDIDLIFIDFNVKRCVSISQIFRLESLSRALSAYPAQIILAKLHNIPEYGPNVVSRIRALLPELCEVHVRVDVPGKVPYVTIYRRVDGPAMPFCNINDDLRLKIEDAIPCQKIDSDGSGSAQTPDSITSPTQLFRSLALTSEPMLPLNFSELPKLKEYAPLPTLGSIFSVRVCDVSNPMSFSVQPYNNDYGKLMNMQRELQEYCDKQDVYIPSDKVEKDEAYAAKNVDAYYRVIAKARYGKMINVSRCDYGDSCTVRVDHLKVLPLKFRNLPIMGINARLYGIKGSADDIWSSEDVNRFRELVLNQKLASYVKAIERSSDNSLLLTLDLVNVAEKEDVYIRNVLIAEKRVLPQ